MLFLNKEVTLRETVFYYPLIYSIYDAYNRWLANSAKEEKVCQKKKWSVLFDLSLQTGSKEEKNRFRLNIYKYTYGFYAVYLTDGKQKPRQTHPQKWSFGFQ